MNDGTTMAYVIVHNGLYLADYEPHHIDGLSFTFNDNFWNAYTFSTVSKAAEAIKFLGFGEIKKIVLLDVALYEGKKNER